jgi:hypothetical protein
MFELTNFMDLNALEATRQLETLFTFGVRSVMGYNLSHLSIKKTMEKFINLIKKLSLMEF